MKKEASYSKFKAKLLQPESYDAKNPWAFIILPKDVSEKLSRRGRISVEGTINQQSFTVLLEPDGQKSHWLKIDKKLMASSNSDFGIIANFEIWALEEEPEPEAPADLLESLAAHPDAKATWDSTTSIAKVDWIHWIVSAKQLKTREKRIKDACDMLASGKKRVCCFDPSGFYSKAFKAPKAVNTDLS